MDGYSGDASARTGKSPVGIPLNGAEFTKVVCLFTHKEEPPRHSNKQPLGLVHVMDMKKPRRDWSERGSSLRRRSRGCGICLRIKDMGMPCPDTIALWR
jgi:hypothetical protein